MALTGSGGIAAVSAGIAEALVTTAFGLFVAIPAVWVFNYFAGKVECFKVEMANSTSELVDFFIKKSGGTAASGSASDANASAVEGAKPMSMAVGGKKGGPWRTSTSRRWSTSCSCC